jgi:hypothetical protein
MKPLSPSSAYRIGTLNVRLPDLPHPALRGLTRDPVPSPSDTVTLNVEVVDRPDWLPTLERGGRIFVKALGSHHCRIDFLQRSIRIRLARNLDRTGWYFVFRDIFAALCGLSGDVFLHASSVEIQGMASAFCAYSGGGKSTIAGLLGSEADIINDEINWAFRDADGRVHLVDQRYYRDPPGSERPTIPLHKVYVIRKADDCAFLDLPTTETFPIILAAPFGDDPMLPERTRAAAMLFSLGCIGGLRFNLSADDVRECLGKATAS